MRIIKLKDNTLALLVIIMNLSIPKAAMLLEQYRILVAKLDMNTNMMNTTELLKLMKLEMVLKRILKHLFMIVGARTLKQQTILKN